MLRGSCGWQASPHVSCGCQTPCHDGWTTRGDSGPIDALRSKFGSRSRDLLAQSSVAKKSRLQADVASCVRRLGLECEEEAIDGESVYSIDILASHCGEHGDVGVGKAALEVGGPRHYLLSRRRTANGNTVVLKRRVLSMLGYTSVSVPFGIGTDSRAQQPRMPTYTKCWIWLDDRVKGELQQL